MVKKLLRHGAEAKIFLIDYFDRKAILKKRERKKYREKVLDEKIMRERTKAECILLHKTKLLGLRTPTIWKISDDFSIIMEFIKGETLKEKLMNGDTSFVYDAGKIVAELHKSNIIHGDLTTANFVVEGNNLALVDFGLGYFSSKQEDKAVDLLNFKKTFLSTHLKHSKKWAEFEKGYLENYSDAWSILRHMKNVEERARYY